MRFCSGKIVALGGLLIALYCSPIQANPVSIHDLVDHPESFVQDQEIELQCYFSRESTAWLHLLSNPSKYTGLFVFENKPSLIISEKIPFPFIFAPKDFHKEIRNLRSGDFILITGKCFKHQAVGKEAVGIVARRISTLDEDGASEAVESEETGEWQGRFNPPKKARAAESSGSALVTDSNSEGTYTIQLGSNALSGLHWGEKYSLNGVEFVVTKDEN